MGANRTSLGLQAGSVASVDPERTPACAIAPGDSVLVARVRAGDTLPSEPFAQTIRVEPSDGSTALTGRPGGASRRPAVDPWPPRSRRRSGRFDRAARPPARARRWPRPRPLRSRAPVARASATEAWARVRGTPSSARSAAARCRCTSHEGAADRRRAGRAPGGGDPVRYEGRRAARSMPFGCALPGREA